MQEVVLGEKNAAADALITVVSAESEKVAKEKAIGKKKNIKFFKISKRSSQSTHPTYHYNRLHWLCLLNN